MAYIHLLARVFIVNLFGFLARWNTRLSLEAARRRVTRKLLVKRILVAAFRVAGRSVLLKKTVFRPKQSLRALVFATCGTSRTKRTESTTTNKLRVN